MTAGVCSPVRFGIEKNKVREDLVSGLDISATSLALAGINNLVHSPERNHQMELAKHRDILYRWILETDDQGRFPESDKGLKAALDRWGNKAVNKEYERVRKKNK